MVKRLDILAIIFKIDKQTFTLNVPTCGISAFVSKLWVAFSASDPNANFPQGSIFSAILYSVYSSDITKLTKIATEHRFTFAFSPHELLLADESATDGWIQTLIKENK